MKARIQEGNTTPHQRQCKKIMNEEEKKIEVQIKNAAVLLKAIDIDQTTVEFLFLQASNIGIDLLSLLFY